MANNRFTVSLIFFAIFVLSSCNGGSSPGLGSLGSSFGNRRVFVTSKGFTPGTPYVAGGNTFASTSDADQACVDLAKAANLGGTWAAWLATSKVSAVDHVVPGRITAETASTLIRNVVQLSGVPVSGALLKSSDPFALSYLGFGSKTHWGPINYTDQGIVTNARVWTGVNGDNFRPSSPGQLFTCSDWTCGVYGECGGNYGCSDRVSNDWDMCDYGRPCNMAHSLYCLEVDICNKNSDCSSTTDLCINNSCQPKTRLQVVYTCPDFSNSTAPVKTGILTGVSNGTDPMITVNLSGEAVASRSQGVQVSLVNLLDSSAARCFYRDGYLDTQTIPKLSGYCIPSSLVYPSYTSPDDPNRYKCLGLNCSIECLANVPWELCLSSTSLSYCQTWQKCEHGTCISR